MEINASNAAAALDAQRWTVTFLGGSHPADRDEAPATEPSAATATPKGVQLPLTMTTVGDRVWVVQIKGKHQMVRRLTDLGIVQGSAITVISRTETGSVIVGFQGCRIGLGAGMAHKVMVTTTQPSQDLAAPSPRAAQSNNSNAVNGDSAMETPLHLGALDVGQSGRILSYERGQRTYREKLLAMGLTPGTSFTVTRQAPMGDPIEIEVRGFKLSLRKGEAAALHVERLVAEEVHHDG